jgi:hypothetical protein
MMDMFYRNHVLQKSLRSILTIFTGNWNTEQRRKREDVKLPGNVINRSEDQNVEWVEALQYIVIIYRLAFFISHRWLPWIDRFSHTQETPAELLGIMAWEFYDKITILHTSYSIFPWLLWFYFWKWKPYPVISR